MILFAIHLEAKGAFAMHPGDDADSLVFYFEDRPLLNVSFKKCGGPKAEGALWQYWFRSENFLEFSRDDYSGVISLGEDVSELARSGKNGRPHHAGCEA